MVVWLSRYVLPLRWLLSALLLAGAVSGCARPYNAFEDCRRVALAPDYGKALARLERSPLAESSKDRLLYLMEKGLLLHLQGEYGPSNQILEQAERLADALFTRSLSAETASFLAGDLIIPFGGEDYEVAYLNYFKALNYLALGDLEGARVECRKVDEKLNYLHDSYGGANLFKESALLRLLTGLIYEAQGEWNDAFIAYRKSLEAYRYYRDKYQVAVPTALWGRLLASARRSGLDEEYRHYRDEARDLGLEPTEPRSFVAVLINAGLVPMKVEDAIVVPSGQGFPIKLAWPRFESRGCGIARVTVSIDGAAPVVPERGENLEAVARQSLEDKKGRVLVKMVARAVAKQVAARRAEKELGPLAGFTAQVAALLTENADLRAWSGLPQEILLALVPVAPGRHRVVVNKGTQQEEFTVLVQDGSVGFVTARVY